MTGGSRSRFLIHFALWQLKAFGKSGFHNKLPTGSRWTITVNGQNTDSQPEDDVKESVVSVQESESKGKVEEVEDYLDSYENSPSDYKQGIHIHDFTSDIFIVIFSISHSYKLDVSWFPFWDSTFSFELRNKSVDDRYRPLLSLHKCIYDPLIRYCLSTVEQQVFRQLYVLRRPRRSPFNRCGVLQDCAVF